MIVAFPGYLYLYIYIYIYLKKEGLTFNFVVVFNILTLISKDCVRIYTFRRERKTLILSKADILLLRAVLIVFLTALYIPSAYLPCRRLILGIGYI